MLASDESRPISGPSRRMRAATAVAAVSGGACRGAGLMGEEIGSGSSRIIAPASMLAS